MVGEVGLEPTISCSQSTCVSRLRYSPGRGHDTASEREVLSASQRRQASRMVAAASE